MSEKRQITWDYRIPLATNRYMLLDSVKVLGISGGFLLVLLIVISGGELVMPLTLAGAVTGFIALIYLFVMVVVFGNAYNATFTIGDDGVSYSSGKRESGISRGAVAVSALAGSWRSLGPALLGSSRLRGKFPWSSIRSIQIDEGRRVLTFTDKLLVQLRVYCTPETFAQCVSIIEDHVAGENIRRS